jgi:hypothetical protein
MKSFSADFSHKLQIAPNSTQCFGQTNFLHFFLQPPWPTFLQTNVLCGSIKYASQAHGLSFHWNVC